MMSKEIVGKLFEDLERLEKLEQVIDILSRVLEIPAEDDIDLYRNDTNYYKLSIKYPINEKEYELLKEVLEYGK